MKVKATYQISLTEEEAIGLKKILGKQSPANKKEIGLNEQQSEAMTNLFDCLPYDE